MVSDRDRNQGSIYATPLILSSWPYLCMFVFCEYPVCHFDSPSHIIFRPLAFLYNTGFSQFVPTTPIWCTIQEIQNALPN